MQINLTKGSYYLQLRILA